MSSSESDSGSSSGSSASSSASESPLSASSSAAASASASASSSSSSDSEARRLAEEEEARAAAEAEKAEARRAARAKKQRAAKKEEGGEKKSRGKGKKRGGDGADGKKKEKKGGRSKKEVAAMVESLESKRDGVRLRYIDFMVRRPCLCMCITMGIAGVLAIAGLLALGADIANDVEFPAPDSTGVRDDVRTQRADGLRVAREDITKAIEERKEEKPTLQSVSQWIVYMIYLVPEAGPGQDDPAGGGLFTPERIERMAAAERIFTADEDAGKFCLLRPVYAVDNMTGAVLPTGESACSAPFSIIPHLYPETRNIDFPLAPAVPLTPMLNASLCPANFTYPMPGGPNGTLVNTPACPYPQWIAASGGPAAVAASMQGFLNFAFSVDRCTGAPPAVFNTSNTTGVMRFYDCDVATGNGQLVTGARLTETLRWLYNNNVYSFFFDKDFDPATGEGTISRAVLQFGAPLGNWTGKDFTDFKTDAELRTEQSQFFQDWAIDFGSKLEEASDKDLDILYFNTALIFDVFIEILISDGLLAFGSLVLVFSYLWTHTQTGTAAALGILHVLMSFPLAFFIYRVVFQIKAFYGLNFLSIYIILAIGADDIFVYYDAFVQSIGSAPDWVTTDRVTRHSWIFRRAAKAMLITSCTTFVAFMSTAFSPLATVSAFGIFTALLVLSNYIFVITWFPCVCIIIDRLHCGVFCCSCCANKDEGEGVCDKTTCKGACYRRHFNTSMLRRDLEAEHGGEAEAEEAMAIAAAAEDEGGAAETSSSHDLRTVEKFFNGKFTDFVTSKARFVIVAVFVVVLAVFVVFATQLQPNTEDEQFLPEDHPFQRTVTLIGNAFTETTTDNYVQVEVVWGLEAPYIDRDGTDRFLPDDIGTAVLAEGFAPHLVADAAADACLDTIMPEKELTRQSLGAGEYVCVTLAMRQGMNASAWAAATASEAAFTSAYEAYLAQQQAVLRQSEVDKIVRAMGVVAGKWSYVSNLHNTSLVSKFIGQPFTITEPFYEEWEEHASSLNDRFAAGFEVIQVSDEWVRMITQKTYVTSAINGAAASIAFAFSVLLLATLNVPIAFFATISIAGVVGIVLGAMVMFGWALGTIESVCATILVGLSVDYNVHIAISYAESKSHDRISRTRDALTEMGVTVLGGALTSALASGILFFCQLQFFFKFGVFMFLTIFSSLNFALLLFPALCAIAGPQGEFGSLKPLLRKLLAKCKKSE